MWWLIDRMLDLLLIAIIWSLVGSSDHTSSIRRLGIPTSAGITAFIPQTKEKEDSLVAIHGVVR